MPPRRGHPPRKERLDVAFRKKRDRASPKKDKDSPLSKKMKSTCKDDCIRSLSPKLRQRGRSPSPRRDNNAQRGRNHHSLPSSLKETNDDELCGLLLKKIMEARLSVGLEKPPSLGSYEGMVDPDDHIEDIDA